MAKSPFSDAQRDAALDAVDVLVGSGTSINAALRQVGDEHGIAPGTIRSWRSRQGRSQSVANRNDAVAVAQEALVDRVNVALADHIEAAIRVRTHGVQEMDARLLSAANAMLGTGIDKLVKLGRLEGAERLESKVAVLNISPEDLARMTDEQLDALARGELPH
jgi:transposase-like protein